MNASRNGNFTSSENYKLMAPGKGKEPHSVSFKTYIDEANMERRLGRSLDNESDARPLIWGKLCEPHVNDLLGLEYQFCSQITLDHPTIPYWKGSPDAVKDDDGRTVADYKCPATLKSFCQLVDPLATDKKIGMDAMNAIRENHKDGDKYYWQIVSNSVLTKAKYGELIVFVPYRSELEEIRDRAAQADGGVQNAMYRFVNMPDEQLPWLPDGGYYQHLYVIRFEIPNVDKWALEANIKEAGLKLVAI